MQVTIGSSRLGNTDGVINVRGDQQIVFEWGWLESELLLTMDLYNGSGYHIARLRRNHWTFNDRERFVFAAEANGVSIVDSSSSLVVIEARVAGEDSVVVTRGVFNSSDGRQIEITVEDWDSTSNSHAATAPAAESTNPPFAKHEIALIRESVMSSHETLECPRCGGPLTRGRLPGATQLDPCLISCITCKRHLVFHGSS